MPKSIRIKNLKRYIKDHLAFTIGSLPVVDRYVFLESFDGRIQGCNPFAIYNSLRDDPRRQNLKFIWSYSGSKPDVARSKDTIYVKHNSLKYRLYLSVSKTIISNSTFPSYFTKKENQFYLNTWHGIPLKKMGYDNKLDLLGVRNVVRNLLACDVILSGSQWMTETIWKNSYKINNIYNGQIAEVGTPRIDELVGARKEESRSELRKKLGISQHDQRKIVLYAPTWAGNNPHTKNKGETELASVFEELRGQFQSTEFLLLIKSHHFVSLDLTSNNGSDININRLTTNELLLVSDQLITDQSSIFFDFLVLDRPIHFYTPADIDQDNTRGIYFDREELPGTISITAERVLDAVRRSAANPTINESKRKKWTDKFLSSEDGRSTERVKDIIFKNLSQNTKKTHRAPDTSTSTKKRILIHVGSLIPNGITTSAINFVHALCELGYDVTILYPYSRDPSKQRFMHLFDKNARHIPRIGNIILPIATRRMYRRFLQGGGWNAPKINPNQINRIFSREWKRCFGNSVFDATIAFDGYSVFWAELLLSGNQKANSIWLHNDLIRDSKRTINGRKPHEKNLSSLFSLYKNFTKLVSVSDGLNEVNKRKMKDYAAQHKFISVRNLLDFEDVISKSLDHPEDLVSNEGPSFVTVGRLSPEKNQELAIRAFSIVKRQYQDATFTIIGDGPLRVHLEQLVEQLGVEDSVIFLGHKANPHPYVLNSDFFVFSSLYEGQGLAMLDALTLGKPVVATRFDIAESVLGEGNGRVVDSTESALSDGMISLITQPILNIPFDPVKHNRLAINEIENLLEDILGEAK